MDVKLYVYDLTRGMARAMSQQFLGIQIDAVYHTSLVFHNIEYFFGAGVQTCRPGATHHGQPMEVVPMGVTHLPLDTILDYLESLKEIYTAESYDLFAHNCNNFTNDFGMFLVGKGIPEHITNLPERVLNTPFGRMLKPQIDASMRSVTQAPVAEEARPAGANGTTGANGASRPREDAAPSAAKTNGSAGTQMAASYGKVFNVTSLDVLRRHLQNASETTATIFFTSSTCAPCKLAYPTFDQLAEEYPDTLFVKVDVNSARDISSHYEIRATPTFMTFSRSTKHDEWRGADPNLLKTNVQRAVDQTFPPHPHTLLKAPTFQFGSLQAYTFTKPPPLDKLMAKLGPDATDTSITALHTFLQQRAHSPASASTPLPNLPTITTTYRTLPPTLPDTTLFAAIDLLRAATADPRISSYLASEPAETSCVHALLSHLNALPACPHNFRLVTLHLTCNIFASPLWAKTLYAPTPSAAQLRAALLALTATSLLDAAHNSTRVAAASLAFNLSVSNYKSRREDGREALSEDEQMELVAGVVESLAQEGDGDAARTLLLALGFLVYCQPEGGGVGELVRAVGARGVAEGCVGSEVGGLGREVGGLL